AEGQSALVVYRSVASRTGVVSGVSLLVDGAPMGDLARDRYAVIDLGPGRHVLAARSRYGESTLTVEAEPGAVEFVQLETSPQPALAARDAEVARVEIATDC